MKQLSQALILILISCSSDSDILEGIDKARLFALPTQDEISAVSTAWTKRNLVPADYTVEQGVDIDNKATFKIISFKLNGIKEYAALIVPKNKNNMPVRMFFGGFGLDVTENSIAVNFNDDWLSDPFVFAFPAFRGQSISITVNGTKYTSPKSEGAHCDAFDGATDDAIAFLNVIQSTEAGADVQRTAVRGGSRGGTVAMLMAERDTRVKIAISIAGPTDMIVSTQLNENDATYGCQFLNDLANGSSDIAATRFKMIASSPLHFVEKLPKAQFHFANDDNIVPPSQGVAVQNKKISFKLDNIDVYYYEGRNHTTIGDNNTVMNQRIEQAMAGL